jgi:AcrR family transcriptional regulator
MSAAATSTKVVPTSARGQRSRQALLEAATAVFIEKGFAGVTVTMITKAAGVAYGSFYVYFESVEAIFTEIAHDLIESFYLATRAPLREKDPFRRMQFENRRYFELYRENAALFHVLEEVVRTNADFREFWLREHRDQQSRMARGIRRLQREGRVDPALNADCAAMMLGGMATRAAYTASLDDQFDNEVLHSTLTALWAGALGLSTTEQAP